VVNDVNPLEFWQIDLEAPVRPRSRWGHGRPPHPELYDLVVAGCDAYAETLQTVLSYTDSYAKIGHEWVSEDQPYWKCGWLSPLDLTVLYSTVVSQAPRTYLEVGSGCSTAFVRDAITRHDLPTRIISIDPEPRAEIDALCDEVIRTPLEDVDPGVFSGIEPGDVVFLDGSHRCFTNSDVTVAFLELLPRLPDGVALGIDDIYLPYDYPPEWANRFYSEQYILSAWLLGGGRRMELRCPTYFVGEDRALSDLVEPLWSPGGLFQDLPRGGNCFWVTIKS
jgi:hypothetical protein